MAKKKETTTAVVGSWNVVDADSFDFLKTLSSVKVRNDILARVIHWQLAKRRAGTHETKEEGDVRGSGKKMFRQKGTGNARQGSRRGPHMRGGAVIFGPHMRDYSYTLPKKIRRLGLVHAIAVKLQAGNLKVIESLQLDTFKTKAISANLKGIANVRKILFVDDNNDNLTLGLRSIVGADILPTVGLNVYDIVNHEVLVISQEALSKIERRLVAND